MKLSLPIPLIDFLERISLLQRTDLFLNEAISLEAAVCLSQSSPASSVALYRDAAAFSQQQH